MIRPDRIVGFQVWPLNVPMREAFEIAGGAETSVRNALVEIRLSGGIRGFGEAAPQASYNQDTQAATLKSLRAQRDWIVGRGISSWRPLIEELDERLGERRGAARAAPSMAVLDAWCKLNGLPMRLLFGGASAEIATDVTVTIMPPEQALEAAKKIISMGVRTIKIKVGRDVDEDEERVRAVARAGKARLILDANQGYSARHAVSLLSKLRRKSIVPALFEQPVAKNNWEGMREVFRKSHVLVAADESASCREDVLKLARTQSAQVVNIKLMKCGLLEAWEMSTVARAAGLGLMIGGNVESTLSMTCSAHLAAGLGGFSFVDLDTPLWFAENPMRGVELQRGGIYDLRRVSAGIGVTPKNSR